MSKTVMNAAIIATVDPVLAFARARRKQIVELIRVMVECESPSGDATAVNRFVELVSDTVAPMAKVRALAGGRFGRNLVCEFSLPGKKKSGQVLALGHSDTVWPVGTLKAMPFRERDGRLWGPGVLDMKSGAAFFIFAMRALRELDIPVAPRVLMQLNSDEEVGSEVSRALTERNARASRAVLVLEPGTGIEGKLKTARKGVGEYRLAVRGKASHSGVDFSAGASAVLEIARQIEKITGFTDLKRGITVNPGVIAGGTRSNVVAAEAHAEIDMRVMRLRDAPALDRKFRALRPFDKRCSLEVTGGLNRPPMERSAGTVKLFRMAKKIAAEMGVRLEESLSGGGSDGNFTAALGVPTLDGLGGVGEGAHAVTESVIVERIPDRVAVLARLVASL